MKNISDIFLYIKKLKASVFLWRSLAIVAFFLFLAQLSIFNKQTNNILPTVGSDYIARVFIEGQIDQNFDKEQDLRALADDKGVKAVVVHIDSPGGSVFGGESLYNTFRYISSKKPVVAVMGSMAASAAYMTAIAADHILAGQSTLTGSIGTIFIAPEFSDLAKKIGIDFVIVKSGKLKAEPLPFHKAPKDALDHLSAIIMEDYDMFVSMVADRRKLSKDQVLLLADGTVITGRTAVRKKLIDGLGNEQDALNWLYATKKVNAKTKIRDADFYNKSKDLNSILKDILPLSIASFFKESLKGIMPSAVATGGARVL